MPKFASMKKSEVYKLWLILAMNQWFRKNVLPQKTQKTQMNARCKKPAFDTKEKSKEKTIYPQINTDIF